MKNIFFTKKHYIIAVVLIIFNAGIAATVISLWTLPAYNKYSKTLESIQIKENEIQKKKKNLEALKKEKNLQESDAINLNGKIGNGLKQDELFSKITDLLPEGVQMTSVSSIVESGQEDEKKSSSEKKEESITNSKNLPLVTLYSCSMNMSITSDSEKGILAFINKLETNEQFFEVDEVTYSSSASESITPDSSNNYAASIIFKYYYVSNIDSNYSVQPGI